MTDAIFLTNWAAAALPMTMPLLLAALGTILLSGVLILYWLYDKIVGIDNMKLG